MAARRALAAYEEGCRDLLAKTGYGRPTTGTPRATCPSSEAVRPFREDWPQALIAFGPCPFFRFVRVVVRAL